MNNDLISREALKKELYDFLSENSTTCDWDDIFDVIDNAPTVEPRIEYGTDGQPYKLSMTNGKEYERTKGDWRDNLIEVFRQSAEVGSDTFHLFEIERIINGEPI